jgi:hypothetical protein
MPDNKFIHAQETIIVVNDTNGHFKYSSTISIAVIIKASETEEILLPAFGLFCCFDLFEYQWDL